MDSLFDEVAARLQQLEDVRGQFTIRAEQLAADLALVGLHNELRDATYSAAELCRLRAQSAAVSLARTAFEAAQQMIVLATEDDYLGVGTRAWLYHRRKERRIAQFAKGVDVAHDWYEQAIGEIRRIWMAYNPDAEKILRHEEAQLDLLQKNRGGADNFMGRNLGKIVEERYPKLAIAFGKSSADLGELNSGIYAALSRESHAQLRLDLAGLRIGPDGTVSIVAQEVDEASKDKLILGCVSSSLAEARAALIYLIDARRKRRAAELAAEADRLSKEPLAPGFKPDLGLHLMRGGGASTTFHFANVPIQKVGILPDGTVRWSGNITLEDQEVYAATFDIPQVLVTELVSAMGVEAGVLAPAREVKKQIFMQPRTLRLACTLGDIQKFAGDAFVPLSVTKIGVHEIESERRPN